MPRNTRISTNSIDSKINYTNFYLPLADLWNVITSKLVLFSVIGGYIFISGTGAFALGHEPIRFRAIMLIFVKMVFIVFEVDFVELQIRFLKPQF